ncbi:MAG: hypothetical protein AAB336_06655 [Acidobacteriota bacterium]
MRVRHIFITLIFTIGLVLTTHAQQSSSEPTPIVFVYGNVIKKSKVSFSETLTLTKAIEKSGGIAFKKKKIDVRIYRLIQGSKDRTEIEVDLIQVIKGKAEDIILKPYDLVYVVCLKGKKCEGLLDFGLTHL